jgi:hypothetical protein
MEHTKKTTYHGLKSIQKYGIFLVCSLAILHSLAFFAMRWIETNELRSELAGWSRTIPPRDQVQPGKALQLPDDIIALHVDKLERVGFYTTRTQRGYLFYANPNNNYILAKSEDVIEQEMVHIGTMLGVLFAGELILLLGWWAFIKRTVRELFEI